MPTGKAIATDAGCRRGITPATTAGTTLGIGIPLGTTDIMGGTHLGITAGIIRGTVAGITRGATTLGMVAVPIVRVAAVGSTLLIAQRRVRTSSAMAIAQRIVTGRLATGRR